MAHSAMLGVCVLGGCKEKSPDGQGDTPPPAVVAETGAIEEMALAAEDAAVPEDDPCLSPCELAGSCEERALEDYEDFDGVLEQWLQNCSVGGGGAFPFVVEGTCADGKRMLVTGGGFTVERRYFDDDGSFIALTTGTDVIDPVCKGQGYWPMRVQCEGGAVTTVHCGTIYEVGDDL